MSKPIKMTAQIEQEIREAFEATLKAVKFADGKFSFYKSFAQTNQKATVYFTEIAWRKMEALIKEFDKEVAWHGVATRIENEGKNEYLISDIFVYPQEVTGATVNTDQEKYQDWLSNLDDEVFNNLRMQGHSHVNMAVSPSPTDISHQEAILGRVEDDMFYIFMIWNKRGEKNIKIYDLAKNTLFEPSDISVSVLGDINMSDFIKEAKGMVKAKENKTPIPSGYTSYYSYYDDSHDYHDRVPTASADSSKKTDGAKGSEGAIKASFKDESKKGKKGKRIRW